ncbi:hypothetical protein [Qingshengfaniella alkalisoli]|uniref:Uncharacterized protein n=1 Tax=Qingshengfaniella alkalisoli TaxID=2599296 RepID=A0A5B8ITB2_9RHOB|nr:hypothetical protein [Qingshengfaniella alkalisoli]QDY68683.1 hypothetical protein FPZ52_02965 [Qingshengfaniella alkalisoli]
MPHNTKIATCCYCGTRAALVLTGRTQHELACSACGAPLSNLKAIRRDVVERAARPDTPGHPRPLKKARTTKKKKSKKKTLTRRFLSEAFDLIDEIID